MSDEKQTFLAYQRSHFATQLPLRYLYSPTHYWVERRDEQVLRVGLTKFAIRMLGEMVDHGFDTPISSAVAVGQILGWIEGFKAISDVYSVAEGRFLGINPTLQEQITMINRDPYGEGWIYEIQGTPDTRCLDAASYRDHLDVTISRLLSKKGTDDDESAGA